VQVDLALIDRLERTAAVGAAMVTDALRARNADDPAVQQPMNRGVLVASGPGRYVNRGVGVTLAVLTDDDLDALEAFYVTAGLPAAVELSAWAPPATVAALTARRFAPMFFRAMFAIDPSTSVPAVDDVAVVPVDDTNISTWLDVYAAGFDVADGKARTVHDDHALATSVTPDTFALLAMIDGRPAGCGTVQVVDGVGWVGAGATLPEFRRRGVQATLLSHRMRLAVEYGCDLVASTAVPSGASARNMARLGFQHVQSQLVVQHDSSPH
jgi:hypothetical protein